MLLVYGRKERICQIVSSIDSGKTSYDTTTRSAVSGGPFLLTELVPKIHALTAQADRATQSSEHRKWSIGRVF